MKEQIIYRRTGIVLLICLIFSLVGIFYVSIAFEWESLSIGMALEKYIEGGLILKIAWVMFLIGMFLVAPVALMLHKVLNSKKTPFLYIGTFFGVLSSIAYMIGVSRWVMLAGTLSSRYIASDDLKPVIEEIFFSFNAYAGNSFGETIAPVAHGLWVIFIGIAIIKNKSFSRVMGIVQIISGIIIMMRPLEYLGIEFMRSFSDIGTQIWCLLFFIVSFKLILSKDKAISINLEEDK